MAEQQANEALEKLNQGIEESKRLVQQQTMALAQDFFDDSIESLKQQIEDNRATLEKLPDQIPGGREETFQVLFEELIHNYANIEKVLDEAQQNVAELDTEQLSREAEVDASEAARREARELGVDISQVEGTGAGGRIVVPDIIDAVGRAGDGEGPKASEMVRRKAEEAGIDLSEVEGSGPGGIITVKDITSLTEGAEGAAAGTAEQATGAAEETTAQTNGAVGQAAEEAGQDQQAAGGESEDGEGPKVTNAARRKAEELGIDLSEIEGSGAGGLITLRDVVNR